ncbi:MAG: DUF4177 domain-containing protein [Rhodobacteraceae bacterium]|nr:DUF4177 domain-containing protein [Paracoccaceae bacterium]
MTRYEYRVVPAPQRGLKTKGAKTTEARFAHALTTLMNEFARDGWEYLRADTLPCEERVGLTGRTTRFQNMLVFRRALDAGQADAEGRAAPVRAITAPSAEAAATGEERPRGPEAPPAAAARLSVAERLAATLTARTREGAAPPLRAVGSDPGTAPRIGAARGQGLSRPEGRGVPAG